MKARDFRRIALGLQDAIESSHMAHPDFRVNGRIFATLSGDDRQGMVKLSPDQQEQFIHAGPAVFTPASGAWGRQGCTMVQLAAADADVVGEAMTLAWQLAVQHKPTKKRVVKKAKK